MERRFFHKDGNTNLKEHAMVIDRYLTFCMARLRSEFKIPLTKSSLSLFNVK